jgi:RNA polymerase sigma factor (sigma-70 family)
MSANKHPEALAALVEEHKGILFKICNSYCSNEAEREDLAQEITYQLLRSYERYDEGYKFTTWMYRVALNVAISFYRKNKRNEPHVPLEALSTEPANDTTDASLEEKIAALYRFIGELKELDKALMILYLEEKPYSEIAEILGISESNAGTRIGRIKEKLKQRFLNTQF